MNVSPDQPVPAEFDLLCEGCGYSLVGLMTDRCPECGLEFDPTLLPLARVPWLYRKRLGRVSAYVQTVRMALFSPRTFAAELCRPVRISVQDAHRFLAVTVHLAALAPVIGPAAFCEAGWGWWPPRVMTAFSGAACLGTWLGSLWILRMATDMPTFIWRGLPERSDDLSPLHHYAAAPLVLLFPAAIAFVVLLFAFQRDMIARRELSEVGVLAVCALGGVVLFLAWLEALIFMRTATRCSFGRVAVLGAYLPVHWLMMVMLVGMTFVIILYYGNEIFG